jgi:hypothetical protein
MTDVPNQVGRPAQELGDWKAGYNPVFLLVFLLK